MATTLEIIQGIHQAAANAYDGALDENGDPVKVGLKREEGDPLIDRRVMDGFNVSIHGNKLCVAYHSEVRLKEVYGSNFESDTEQMIEDIASFLKKEYRKVTGESLSLKAVGECDMIVQNTSKVRSWVQARKHYEISSLAEVEGVPSSEDETADTPVDPDFEKFMKLGGLGTKAKNDKRPKS
tara:strand:- start:19159 stop:19704 length:546 start_codon:yes stop_codon:yes gene_type:complete